MYKKVDHLQMKRVDEYMEYFTAVSNDSSTTELYQLALLAIIADKLSSIAASLDAML